MRFTLHLFGAEVFSVYIGPDPTADPFTDPGESTSYPVGFSQPPHVSLVPEYPYTEE